jgi:hypothetical protein
MVTNRFEMRENVEVTLVNCTPHEIILCASDGTKMRSVPTSGSIARCATERTVIGSVVFQGMLIPVAAVKLGEVIGLPAPKPGTIYIVSAIAGAACKAAGRTDVVLVDDAVRDSEGRVIGARALARP